MRPALYRMIGVTLVVAALVGLLFSLLGIGYLWTRKPAFTASLLDSLQLVTTTLQTTSAGLGVAEDSLTKAAIDVSSLETTLITTSRTISSTLPMLNSMTTMLGTDLPNTIASAQTSLETAQTSAKLIEDVLTTVSALTAGPFIPGDPYAPEVPLYIALGDLSTSLDPLDASLKTIEASIKTSRGNLIIIQAEFTIMADHVHEINTSLAEAKSVIKQYQKVTGELHTAMTSWQARLPGLIDTGAILMMIGLIWLGFTQVGLFFQGLDLFEKARRLSGNQK